MLRLLGTLVLLASAAWVQAPARTLRVLFIGNSLTFANDLPGMVRGLARTNGALHVETEAIARANFSLEDHWKEGAARQAIAGRRWDVVVLQQGPSSQPDSRVLLRAYVKRFDEEIRQAGARTAVYSVWPSRARLGDFDGVSQSYALAARDVGGLLMPAGDAWRAAWRRNSSLPLYDRDQFHPSPLGSCLAALVIFEVLSGKSASSTGCLPADQRGDRAIAEIIEAAARESIGALPAGAGSDSAAAAVTNIGVRQRQES